MNENFEKYFYNTTVVIIGGDHHNTLSVIRCFGKARIPFQVLILVSADYDQRKPKISYSRYVKKNYKIVQEKEDELLQELLSITKEKKSVLLPCSDYAAYVIDKFSDKFSEKCSFPKFYNMPQMVCTLMDKWEQVKFATKQGIPVAKSWKLADVPFIIPSDIIYPCIVKPIVSAFGAKIDICIAKNDVELKKALLSFEKKHYTDVLIQEYIHKDYEALAMGCICKYDYEDCETIIKKIREYPIDKGGSTAFGVTLDDKDVYSFHHRVVDCLRKMGFCGVYDIEYFICKNKIILNEINFRHSGSGYVLIGNGVPAPIVCALSLLGINLDQEVYKRKISATKYNMCEIQDARYLKLKRISIKEFWKDLKRTSTFSEFDKTDLIGTWGFYREIVLSKIRRK